MIATERETSIVYTDADAEVLIYTCRRSDITRLRGKLGRGVRMVESGTHTDGTPYARFAIPLERFNIAGAVRRVAAGGSETSDLRQDTPPREPILGGNPTHSTSESTPPTMHPETPPREVLFNPAEWITSVGAAYQGDLGRTARRLAELADTSGKVEASSAMTQTIARAAGISRPHVESCVAQLREMRVIEHLPKRDGRPAMWRLVAAQPVTVRVAP